MTYGILMQMLTSLSLIILLQVMSFTCKTFFFSQTGFLKTLPVCYWSNKSIATPQTHTIGCVTVAVLGWADSVRTSPTNSLHVIDSNV